MSSASIIVIRNLTHARRSGACTLLTLAKAVGLDAGNSAAVREAEALLGAASGAKAEPAE